MGERYLQNTWYVAAFDNEITRVPLRRVLFGQPLVLYRTEGHVPVALLDRCPHRFVPLSCGKLIGDELQCGYHGLRFGPDGACTLNPHGEVIPQKARVPSFALVERYRLIWIWPGDQELVDPNLIPTDFEYLWLPHIRSVRGYLRVEANYQLIVDNLLDLSHTDYVHPQFAETSASDPSATLPAFETALVHEGHTIWAKRWSNGTPPTNLQRFSGATAERVNSRAHMHWIAPALLQFDLGFTECTEEAKDFAQPGAHFVTPESQLVSHYFFTQGRSTALDSPEIDAIISAGITFAFSQQDEPLLEAQQRQLGETSDLMAGQPVLLKTDAATVAVRRLLDRMIAEEAKQSAEWLNSGKPIF